MKKITKILSLLLALVFAMSTFVACGEPIVEQVIETVYEGGSDKVTVQWVWGQVVLKEELVDRGSYLTPWTPEVEGREFEGWYEIPEKIKTFRFDKTPIKNSMRIYASFSGGPLDVETEAPDWYLIGTGKGDLSKSNWQHGGSMQHLGLYAGEDGIYKITLELYAGDAFKLTRDEGWADEKAIDKMAGFANGKVTDANGTVVFTAGQNNNIVVAEGQNGKYEITYDPNADQLGFTKLQELGEKPDDIRLIGGFNNWNQGTKYGETDYKFTPDSENVIWTYTWVAEANTEFKVYNNISGNYYPDGTDNNLKITTAGTYTVTFNLKTQAIVVTDENGNPVDVGSTGGNGGGSTGTGTTEIRVVGTFNGWKEGSTPDWNLTKGANGVWTGTFTFDIQVELKLHDMGGVYGHDGGWIDEGTGAGENGNLVLQPGTYNFEYVEGNSTFICWAQGTEKPATPSGGNVGGNTGSDVPTGSLPEGEGTLVFFVNDWNWSDVKCHYWGGTASSEWPGTAMTKVGTTTTSNGTKDVYAIRVAVGTTGIQFNGIKDDGSGNRDQSPDITTGIVEGAAWKMVWIDGNAVESVIYSYQ